MTATLKSLLITEAVVGGAISLALILCACVVVLRIHKQRSSQLLLKLTYLVIANALSVFCLLIFLSSIRKSDS